MALTFPYLFSLINLCFSPLVGAKIFMVLMEEEPVLSYKTSQIVARSDEDVKMYKEGLKTRHDGFISSICPSRTCTKLYSYTHLLNGFALHTNSEEVPRILKNTKGARIYEDTKMVKLTTHSPEFLGIPADVWPALGGAQNSGEGVVIGIIDTGINPFHPSFASPGTGSEVVHSNTSRFKGKCEVGRGFPANACGAKIAGAQYFARAAITAGDFNATRDYASPFDADGHGSHTASTAAGNHQIPVIANGFNYGYASGMAPGARIAVYKALYSFGGYMSDVVAAVDQAVEDGVDILSLSIGPSSVPPGPSAFLNVLEMELLFAAKAGVFVVQAAGNGGPSDSSVLSFSPWITTVAASITDRKYNNSIELGNGLTFSGTGLAPPTPGQKHFQIASAMDICVRNSTYMDIENCQHPEPFIPILARGKLVICTYSFDFELESASISTVADTIQKIGAVGFILTMDPGLGAPQVKGTTITLPVPGIVLSNMQSSSALWEYYRSRTVRNQNGVILAFVATGRIMDGRNAIYTRQAPVVASYSSRGPDVNNALMQTADVLKPNIMAPGSSIWAAWSPNSEGDQYIIGQNFALVSGTSMATPHVAGVAALIKQKHPDWSPAAIASSMMTTADVMDHTGAPILAQQSNQLGVATPFDYGAGAINPARAIDPGLVFDANFKHYVQFLCAVPGVDNESVLRAVGIGCPQPEKKWCSDLNTPSVTISNLVGSRKVERRVTNVAGEKERYIVRVREPAGVNVTVAPMVFVINANASRHMKFMLEAREGADGYKFGEVVMEGDRNHEVRVPIAVYVTSVLG